VFYLIVLEMNDFSIFFYSTGPWKQILNWLMQKLTWGFEDNLLVNIHFKNELIIISNVKSVVSFHVNATNVASSNMYKTTLQIKYVLLK